MTVLLLDERWPTLIPMEAFSHLGGPVTFTDEVPVKVRWNFADLISPTGEGVVVSTNEHDPLVRDCIAQGQKVIAAPSREDNVRLAVQAMERARSIGEWEKLQTHQTLVPYLKEEVQEFVEEVARWEDTRDEQALKEEIGDVLLQVLFHAEIAARRGAFDFQDVAQSFVDKLKSRAPYLFDGTASTVGEEEQKRLWLLGKAREVQAKLHSRGE